MLRYHHLRPLSSIYETDETFHIPAVALYRRGPVTGLLETE